ncbi:hypothetical protein ACS0TY_026456 [Phlomoides rotata]
MEPVHLNRRGRSEGGGKNAPHVGHHHNVLDRLRPNDHLLCLPSHHPRPPHRQLRDPDGLPCRFLRGHQPPHRPHLRPHHHPHLPPLSGKPPRADASTAHRGGACRLISYGPDAGDSGGCILTVRRKVIDE